MSARRTSLNSHTASTFIQPETLSRLRSQWQVLVQHLKRLSPRPHASSAAPSQIVSRWMRLQGALLEGIIELDNPLPPWLLTPDLYSRWPTEVPDIINNCLVDVGCISVPSSTVHHLSRRCRPSLFRSLHLRSSADIYFLENILRSELSGWLAERIERIEITPEYTPLVSIVLFSLLPSLKALVYYPATFRRDPQEYTTLPLPLRLGISNLRNLVALSLNNYRFPSFHSLLSFISPLSSLGDLTLRSVVWKTTRGIARVPSFNAAFSNIRCIHATDGSPHWPLTYILAASSVGCQYKRRRQRRCNVLNTIMSTDLLFIVQLVRLIEQQYYLREFRGTINWEKEGKVISLLELCVITKYLRAGTCELAIALWHDILSPIRLAFFMQRPMSLSRTIAAHAPYSYVHRITLDQYLNEAHGRVAPPENMPRLRPRPSYLRSFDVVVSDLSNRIRASDSLSANIELMSDNIPLVKRTQLDPLASIMKLSAIELRSHSLALDSATDFSALSQIWDDFYCHGTVPPHVARPETS